MKKISSYIIFLLCNLFVAAQDTVVSAKMLDTVIVRGESIKIKEKAPSGDNLDSKDLQIINTQNVGDAAKFLSGVLVRDYGGLGGVKTVSVRGLSSNHTSVLYDGVNIFDNQSGQIDLSKYSLASASTLSLANAQFETDLPTATSLAFSSSINIQTRRPQMGDKKLKGDLSLGYGSFNVFNGDLFLASRVSNKDIVTLLADITNTDGKYPYRIYYGANQQLSTEKRIRQNNDLFSYHLESNWFHTFSANRNLKAKAYYYYSNRGLPSNVNLYYQNSKQRLWNKNFFAQTVYSYSYKDRLFYKNNLKVDYSYTRYIDPYYRGSVNGQDDEYTQKLAYMNNSVGVKMTDDMLFTVTQDMSFSNLNSNSLEAVPNRFSLITAAVINYKYENIDFTADVVGSQHYDFFGDTNRDYHHLSPFASIRYENGSYTGTLFYKNIFRMPTFNELYYMRMGNRDLRPEKTNQISWANVFTFDFKNLTIQPEIDIYYNIVKDKIVAIPKNIFLWTMINYGRADIYGADIKINAKYCLTPVNLSLKLNYSLQTSIDQDKTSPTYKQHLPYMPANIGSVVFGADYKKLNFGLTCLYVGERYSLQENIPQNLLKSYVDISANISYDMDLKSKYINRLKLMLACNNITDKQYEVVRAYPMIGRNFNFKLQIYF